MTAIFSNRIAVASLERELWPKLVSAAVKTMPSSLAMEDLPAPKQLAPNKVSDTSVESANNPAFTVASSNPVSKSSKLQSSVKISSTLAQTTPGGSAFKTKAGAGSAKLLEKKKAHTAASEARKARLAEMRQKVNVHCKFVMLICFMAS